MRCNACVHVVRVRSHDSVNFMLYILYAFFFNYYYYILLCSAVALLPNTHTHTHITSTYKLIYHRWYLHIYIYIIYNRITYVKQNRIHSLLAFAQSIKSLRNRLNQRIWPSYFNGGEFVRSGGIKGYLWPLRRGLCLCLYDFSHKEVCMCVCVSVRIPECWRSGRLSITFGAWHCLVKSLEFQREIILSLFSSERSHSILWKRR